MRRGYEFGERMKLVMYGLTITSSWGNGHATTFRSLVKALHARGHSVRFIEKDVEWYRSNRDLPQPNFCSVRLYEDWGSEAGLLLEEARGADAIVIGSYFPDASAAMEGLLQRGFGPVLFYDIDTPITMSALRSLEGCAYLLPQHIPEFAAYLSFTGGPALRELEQRWGSPMAVPFYCSVDPELYKPVLPRAEFACSLSYLGTYAADRQPKLERLLNEPARLLEEQAFVVAGPMYPEEAVWPANVKKITHVAPSDHPAFYSSARFTLNLTRDDMVQAGYSPSVRLFEAAACGAAMISDWWPGLDSFFTPNVEILVPLDTADVVRILQQTSAEQRSEIGRKARERVLSEHTSAHRAEELERVIAGCHARR